MGGAEAAKYIGRSQGSGVNIMMFGWMVRRRVSYHRLVHAHELKEVSTKPPLFKSRMWGPSACLNESCRSAQGGCSDTRCQHISAEK
jgi:hypothetical protein